MKIISADYIVTCDSEFTILENMALCFDDKIIEIAPLDILKKRYNNADIVESKEGSILMPGLINLHIHLEFSSNRTTLKYGNFISWLESVITYRDELSCECDESYIDKILDQMLSFGVTTIGAISSFGRDLNSTVKSPINVIYFNEVLGSNPAAVDMIYGDFLERLQESRRYKSNSFIPAISIHSPYSTHPILAKKALKEERVVSTHFMESMAERDWLRYSKGEFLEFFKSFTPSPKPINTPLSFLELFKEHNTLFTHANYADKEEMDLMNSIGTITHAPVSNRLLGGKRLDINRVKNLTLATDGLSSNNSLNMWDEMRAALMLHGSIEPNLLAKKLILASTSNGAKAVGRESGVLKEGYDSDIVVVNFDRRVKDVDNLPLSLLLHTKKVSKTFIAGELMPLSQK